MLKNKIMKLEIDLKNIEQIAKRKEAENISFRTYLKGQNSEKIDKIVHRLNEDITPKIDCLDCGNCCMNLRPIVSEVSRFAEAENIEAVKYLKSFPCKYIKDKKCTIYSDRFEECREFPYMHRDKFITRLHGVLQNYEICPIVFNIYEHLKIELGWRYK